MRPARLPHAIPAVPARLRGSGLFPFGYETDPGTIRATLDDYAHALATERACLAWALKQGRLRAARQSRAFIDQIELRRRNGEARLRALATGGSEPGQPSGRYRSARRLVMSDDIGAALPQPGRVPVASPQAS